MARILTSLDSRDKLESNKKEEFMNEKSYYSRLIAAICFLGFFACLAASGLRNLIAQ
jgi:hypothetical protein